MHLLIILLETISSTDVIDLVIKGLTAIVGLALARKAIKEFKENREQREKDFRWKQAELAKKFIDEILHDGEAKMALLMLDWDDRDFKFGDKEVKINNNVLKNALRTTQAPFSEEEKIIRDDFDTFFYYIERMEQYLQNNLFEKRDIRFPMEYYLNRIKDRELSDTINSYLMTYRFENTQRFIKRMKK